MKKFLVLFGALTLSLTSCSSDDSSSDSQDTPNPPVSSVLVLLKKNISTDANGNKIITNLEYDGNKIIKMTREGSTDGFYFTYNGNLITKEEFKYNGNVELINKYEYDSNNFLISYVSTKPMDEYGRKEEYKYETDGSITVNTFAGGKFNGTHMQTYSNGNLVKIVMTDPFNYVFTEEYEYDNKNNPSKNILGFNKLINRSGGEGSLSSVNNTLKYTYSASANNNSPDVYKREIIYNNSGYPTKIISYKNDGITVDRINEYTY